MGGRKGVEWGEGRGRNGEEKGRKEGREGKEWRGKGKKREDGGRGGEETKEAIHNVSYMYMYAAS